MMGGGGGSAPGAGGGSQNGSGGRLRRAAGACISTAWLGCAAASTSDSASNPKPCPAQHEVSALPAVAPALHGVACLKP